MTSKLATILVLAATIAGPSYALGSAFSTAPFASDNPYSIHDTNVFYDLAVLFGDQDGDGKVSVDEYTNFDINSLASDASKLEDPDFKFLSWYPYKDGNMYFYVYSQRQLSTSMSYAMQYFNAAKPKEDNSGYEGDVVKTVSPLFLNSYHGKDGFFSKLYIKQYEHNPNIKDERIKGSNFTAYDSGANKFLDKAFDAELFFDDKINSSDGIAEFYNEDTYLVNGLLEGYLTSLERDQSFWLGIPQTGATTSLAAEAYYYFFDFDDADFSIDELIEVRYAYNYLVYEVIENYGLDTTSMGGASAHSYVPREPTVYEGKYEPNKQWGLNNYGFNRESFANSMHEVSRTPRIGITQEGVKTKFKVIDKGHDWWEHAPIVRESEVDSIVDLETFDTKYPEQKFKPFRDFLQAGIDRSREGTSEVEGFNASWAFQINYDSKFNEEMWHREYLKDRSKTVYEGKNDFPGGTSWKRAFTVVSEGHEPADLVTLSMKVRQASKVFTIKTINDPASVDLIFMVGYPAPTIWEFIANDFAVAWNNFIKWITENPWIWIVIVGVLVLLLGVLASIFPPVFAFVKFAFNGLLNVGKFLIVLAWFPIWLVWKFIDLFAHSDSVPALWFWGK